MIYFLITFFSSLLHESGHISAILLSSSKATAKITFAGIVIKKDDLFLSYKEDFAIYLSGPFVNLLSFLLFRNSPNVYLSFFSSVSFVLFFVNMIPIGALDGGKALYSLISYLANSLIAEKICRVISDISIAVLFVFSICLMLTSEPNFSLYLMAGSLFYSAFVKSDRNI